MLMCSAFNFFNGLPALVAAGAADDNTGRLALSVPSHQAWLVGFLVGQQGKSLFFERLG